MAQTDRGALVRLKDTELTVEPAEDIRGHNVYDREGEEIGHVDDLLVDDREGKVRFLQIAAGGFLGLGERKFMVPVDAVTRVQDGEVRIDQTRERVVGTPEYDPEVVEERYWDDLYGYYGYTPFWAPGYTYPGYPYYI